MQTVCTAIAVLLPYLYLVMFMWMLMEGVVLYVKIVKVFTANHKHYIAIFTIASYGKVMFIVSFYLVHIYTQVHR